VERGGGEVIMDEVGNTKGREAQVFRLDD